MAVLSAVQSRAGLTCIALLSSATGLTASVLHATDVVRFPYLDLGFNPIVILVIGLSSSGIALVVLLAGLAWQVPARKSLWDRLLFDVATWLAWIWTSSLVAVMGRYLARAYDDQWWRGDKPASSSCTTLMAAFVLTLALLQLLSATHGALALAVLAGSTTDQEGSLSLLWQMANAPLPKRVQSLASFGATETTETTESGLQGTRRDKFDEGRLLWYMLLLLFSIGEIVCASMLIVEGRQVGAAPVAIATGSLSLMFALYFLALFRMQVEANLRKLEVGLATALLLLWSWCAIAVASFPGTPRWACQGARPRANDGATRSWGGRSDSWWDGTALEYATATLILAVLSAGVLFLRLMGLVFPTPEAVALPRETTEGPEGELLPSSEEVQES